MYLFRNVLQGQELANLELVLSTLPIDMPGIRLTGMGDDFSCLSEGGSINAIAAKLLGPMAKPVRAILFDKSVKTNWALGWHQDRTIAVAKRHEVEGFGSWSTKAGIQHVEPPFFVFESMATLRVHIDPVDESNAPLLVLPGSHRMGRIEQGNVAALASRISSFACLAQAGDVWAYSTPILHASNRATPPRRRRVLQIDYTATDLPGGLEWRGI